MYSPIQFLLCRPVENFRYNFFSILKHYIYLSNTQINPFFSMFHFFIKIEKKEKERSFNSILCGKKKHLLRFTYFELKMLTFHLDQNYIIISNI